MNFLVKLTLVAVALGFLVSVLMPQSPVGEVVNAAIEDVGGFCERNANACDQGSALAYRTSDLIAAAVQALAPDGEGVSTLTQDDRALAPPTATTAPQTPQPAIATHTELPKP
ncbi:MAG: hypothetical protein AAFW98_00155 [Pseudomonadota bacterium]